MVFPPTNNKSTVLRRNKFLKGTRRLHLLVKMHLQFMIWEWYLPADVGDITPVRVFCRWCFSHVPGVAPQCSVCLPRLRSAEPSPGQGWTYGDSIVLSSHSVRGSGYFILFHLQSARVHNLVRKFIKVRQASKLAKPTQPHRREVDTAPVFQLWKWQCWFAKMGNVSSFANF